MKLSKLFYLLLVLPLLFVYTGCSSDDSGGTDPVETVVEAQVLAQYLEANGDVINSAPFMITAEAVRTAQLAGASQYIIDIRSTADFANGHIEGAVNVAFADIVSHVASINASSYETIVITCYSGQTAGYATAILRMLGYNNVKDLKWGMSGWNADCANSWLPKLSNAHAADLVTTASAKGTAGDYPTLSTGLTTGSEILDARIDALLTAGFGAATIDISTLYSNLSNYYIVNYWSTDHYNLGHISGAVQYTPGTDLKTTTNLLTLPTDKTIVVYCYTGQTSAHIAAYLRLLGYDAKTLTYGVNCFAYDWLVGNGMTHFDAGYVMGYPYVTN